jgi:hypothetical protein
MLILPVLKLTESGLWSMLEVTDQGYMLEFGERYITVSA